MTINASGRAALIIAIGLFVGVADAERGRFIEGPGQDL